MARLQPSAANFSATRAPNPLHAQGRFCHISVALLIALLPMAIKRSKTADDYLEPPVINTFLPLRLYGMMSEDGCRLRSGDYRIRIRYGTRTRFR